MNDWLLYMESPHALTVASLPGLLHFFLFFVLRFVFSIIHGRERHSEKRLLLPCISKVKNNNKKMGKAWKRGYTDGIYIYMKS